jgi:hypothetical protein
VTLTEFENWFDDVDLGRLEPIREYVWLHAVQNNDHEYDLAAAMFTVKMYIDDASLSDPLLDMYAGRVIESQKELDK